MDKHAADQLTGADNIVISVLMSIAVVDKLQMIHIHHDKTEFRNTIDDIPFQRFDLFIVGRLVLDLGQGILERLGLQALVFDFRLDHALQIVPHVLGELCHRIRERTHLIP